MSIKVLPAEMTGGQIYDEWEIPRGRVREIATTTDLIRMRTIFKNGIERKCYNTRDVVAYFGCDMEGRAIAEESAL